MKQHPHADMILEIRLAAEKEVQAKKLKDQMRALLPQMQVKQPAKKTPCAPPAIRTWGPIGGKA